MKSIQSVSLKFWLPSLILIAFILLSAGLMVQEKIVWESDLIKTRKEFITYDMASLKREMEKEILTNQPLEARQALLARGVNIEYRVLIATDEQGRIQYATRFELVGQLAVDVLPGFDSQYLSALKHNHKTVVIHNDKHQLITAYFPITLSRRPDAIRAVDTGILFLVYDLSSAQQKIWGQVWQVYWPLLMGALILMILMIIFINRFVDSPMQHLILSTQRFSRGESDGGCCITGNGELASLGTVFNEMMVQLNERLSSLEISNKRYDTIFKTAPDAIITTDERGIIDSFNPVAEKIFLYTAKEVIGKNACMLMTDGYKTNKEGYRDGFSSMVDKKTFGMGRELTGRKKDGSTVELLISVAETGIQGDQCLSAILIDITDRKRVEEELKKYRDNLEDLVSERTTQLETANKELKAFSYSVSHDLRAPLRAIEGFTSILMKQYVAEFDDEGKRLGSVIQKNSRKMSNLIDDLLAFSRMGRTSMHCSRIDMQNLANTVFDEASTPENRQRVRFNIGDLCKVEGDTNMIRQVWINLISNALKFSSNHKQAVISVTCREEGDELIYCIKDNGVGFDMKYKDKLFGVFQRLHSEKEFEGTGVGLAIAQRIILRHGGQIWGEGEKNKGASFYFSLPKKQNCIG